MKHLTDQHDVNKLAEMYFDQTLDPQTKDEFLQKVGSDPAYAQAYQREQSIRDNIRKHIRRPGDNSQLIQAIKNQIRKP